MKGLPFRLAAFDLDGTLLSGAWAMSDENAAALRELAERGVVVAPVTARYHAIALLPFAAAGLTVPAVSSAGAEVRAADGAVIEQRALTLAAARHLADLADRADWRVTLSTTGPAIRRAPDLPAWAASPPPHLRAVTSLRDVAVDGVLSALISAPADDPWLKELDGSGDALNIHLAKTHDGQDLVTVTAAGVDKGSGLAALCNALGIDPVAAVAFGDSDVDIPMFLVAGRAVAMEGSPPEVAAAAQHRAPASPGGVAQAIRALLAGL